MLAASRVAFGTALTLAPGPVGRPWVGRDSALPSVRMVARTMGARDAMLGVGALLALEHDAPVRGWLEAGMASDVVDATAALMAWRHLPRVGRLMTVVAAGTAAVMGARLARLVD
jgi:hypothetical protein